MAEVQEIKGNNVKCLKVSAYIVVVPYLGSQNSSYIIMVNYIIDSILSSEPVAVE